MGSIGQNPVKLIGVSGAYRGTEFIVTKDEYIIGRHPQCDLVLKETTISSRHCRLQKKDGRFQIVDMGSTNGTYVNGERVTVSDLRHDDRVQFDVYEFIFANLDDVSRTMESAIPCGITVKEKDENIEMDTQAEIQLPQASVSPISTSSVTQTLEKKDESISKEKGSFIVALWASLLLSFLISVGGGCVLKLLEVKSNIASDGWNVFLNQWIAFPFLHLHTVWENVPWGWIAITALILILIGPVAAGWMGKVVWRRRTFLFSMAFTSAYAGLSVIAQIVSLASVTAQSGNKFRFQLWFSSYYGKGLPLQPLYFNVAASLVYFMVIVFVLHFLGGFLPGKRK